MLGELRVRPVEIPDEGLKSVKLPEEVLRGGAPVAGKILIKLILNYGKWWYFGRDEFSFIYTGGVIAAVHAMEKSGNCFEFFWRFVSL